MDSIPLMLDDPFDVTSVNLNHLIYHPSQLQETLPNQQIPPTRVPLKNEGICLVSNAGDGGDLDNNRDNIELGVENGDDVGRVGKRQKKMVMHREVERQRRKEMASLHASLRSLLPLQYLKGKRSMSDHLNEAVKYISHLKARNQVLRNNKDKLTCTPDTNPSYVTGNHRQGDPNKDFLEFPCSSRRSDRIVVVNSCKGGGVEVVLRVGQEDKLPLSLILKALAQEGLDVTNCICTNMGNNAWLHCLQAQAREGISIDASKLQQQLCFKA